MKILMASIMFLLSTSADAKSSLVTNFSCRVECIVGEKEDQNEFRSTPHVDVHDYAYFDFKGTWKQMEKYIRDGKMNEKCVEDFGKGESIPVRAAGSGDCRFVGK